LAKAAFDYDGGFSLEVLDFGNGFFAAKSFDVCFDDAPPVAKARTTRAVSKFLNMACPKTVSVDSMILPSPK